MKLISELVNEATAEELQLKNIENIDIVDLLQQALAEEFNQWYMYTIVLPYAVGPERSNIIESFKEFAKDELEDHAYWLMERINQLGAIPWKVLSPTDWDNATPNKYIRPYDFHVKTLLQQNIEAEKNAIKTYTDICEFTKGRDLVTYSKCKAILADEQEHLAELQDFIADLEAIDPCIPTCIDNPTDNPEVPAEMVPIMTAEPKFPEEF